MGSVVVEDRGFVRFVIFNKPDVYNAFDSSMRMELLNVLDEAEEDDGVRVVVLTGAGRAFAAGEDLRILSKLYQEGKSPDFKNILLREYHPILKKIRGSRKPYVAAVNGAAAGAGMSIALACDYKIASEEASFTTAFVKIGLVPDTGIAFFLPRVVGFTKAMEFFLLSERIDAKKALELGLVNEVVSSGELQKRVEEVASKLAELPPLAIAYTKRLVNESLFLDLEKSLQLEAELQHMAGSSEDHIEGVRAFIEKRKPTFKGK